MLIQGLIASRRKQLGLSQTFLATKAGVSLPTVQKIEAGDGNPSIETFRALLDVLGLSIEIQNKNADWNYLSKCGLPINASEFSKDALSREQFLKELRLGITEVCEKKEEDTERKKSALCALLTALKLHYPSVYKETVRMQQVSSLLKTSDSERLPKMKRIALEGLSKFL